MGTKHCLNNQHFALVEYEIPETNEFKDYVIKGDKILSDDKLDFALLLIRKRDFEDLIEKLPIAKITTSLIDSAKYHFRGYPSAFQNQQATRLEANLVEEIKKGYFKLRTVTHLTDSSGNQTIDAVSGFSGSGVFIEVSEKLYLCGFVVQLANESGTFNEINCHSLGFLNSFLKHHNLPELEVKEVVEIDAPLNETVYTNLIKIEFPNVVYQADTNFSRNEIIKKAQETKYFPYDARVRQVVYEAMRQTGADTCIDWISSNNKILTFQDIQSDSSPLSRIIDKGTVTSLEVTDFYKDQDRENLLKSLLQQCLSKKLSQLQVYWKHKDKVFAFGSLDANLGKREIEWRGKVKATRTVFETKMKDKVNESDPDKIDYCKHLAFGTGFIRVEDHWYLEITPDWFVSYNGKDRHNYKSKALVSFWKRQERDTAVFRACLNLVSN